MQAFGEAPGRLDFLGGVADYSGSLVLQMPIGSTTRVAILEINEPLLQVESTQQERVAWPLEKLGDVQSAPARARYVLGSLQLFCKAMNWRPERGLRFEINSDVPVSMGVSSSAALEVATLRALENFAGKKFAGTELAKLAQRVENEIVLAPCGLMDQLTCAHGVQNSLLPILCRPDILRPPIALPEGVLIAGWPSGVKHAVSDSPYATARCAAFMGKKILEKHFVRELKFLTELAPLQVRSVDESTLPATMRGDEFLKLYGGVDDALSVVEPERLYPLRAGTLFPVEENFRCELVTQLLPSITSGNRARVLSAIGELMFESHAGYSSIGLGCDETDAMAEAIRSQLSQGFYGARVSGGGSGGTVAVLLEKAAWSELQRLSKNSDLII